MLDADMRLLLENYIAQHAISLESFQRSRRYWNNDRRNALQAALPAGGYVLHDAIAAIRSILDV